MDLMLFVISLLTFTVFNAVNCDTVANCTYENIEGLWTFYESDRGNNASVDCSAKGQSRFKSQVKLSFPNVAVDEFGNHGYWTMIYNQGFEAIVHGRKYFAFSEWSGTPENFTYDCTKTSIGWSHNLLSRDWSCFSGTKVGSSSDSVVHGSVKQPSMAAGEQLYRHDDEMIAKINAMKAGWWAAKYPEYERMTWNDMRLRAGGKKWTEPSFRQKGKLAGAVGEVNSPLPAEWDWRNVDGVNYVSRVRNQAACGSCYAFASMGMLEARLRILTNNTVTPTFSPQDVVTCSQYSQGCGGGFPYLIAGKYAEDFGVVDESCVPYTGKDGSCTTKANCKRYYATNYRYVGGFYGGSNEILMKEALVKNGPLAVSFMVYSDFTAYKGGIYQHVYVTNKFNPFEITNHVVVVVGYGAENGVPFWIVKNSWGTQWGEKGFFRIRRGTDECGLESIAVESFPIY